MDVSSSRLFSTFGKKVTPYASNYQPLPASINRTPSPIQPFEKTAQGFRPPHAQQSPTPPYVQPPNRLLPLSTRYITTLNSASSATRTGQAMLDLAVTVHDGYPNLHKEAANFIREAIKSKLGKDVDPDAFYLNRFGAAHTDNKAFSGWGHNQQPLSSMTLTQAVYANYRAYDQANSDVLDAYGAGIYRDAAGAESYDSRNELKMLPTQLLKLINEGDFNARYNTRLEAFWEKHIDHFRTLAKSQFIANLLKQKTDSSLEAFSYRLVLKGMGEATLTAPVSAELLQAKKVGNVRGVHVRKFDINGYEASDILHFKQDSDRRVVLYIPGGVPAFKGFTNADQLSAWVIGNDPKDAQRQSLASHFSLHARQDGASPFGRYGIDHVLQHLSEKTTSWSQRHINYNHSYGSATIEGDLFSYLASSAKARDFLDAATRITSNSEINRDIWLAYLEAFNSITMAGAPMFAPINLMFAAGSAARITLGLRKAVEGDTGQQRADGLSHALGGVLGLADSATINTSTVGIYDQTILDDFAAQPAPVESQPTGAQDPPDASITPAVGMLDRMGWRKSAAQRHRTVAKQVFKEVRGAYEAGLKSGNKVYIDVPKEILHEGRDIAADAAIKQARQRQALGTAVSTEGADSGEALRIHAANCGDLSQIAAKRVMASGIHAEQWSIEGADHSFTVVGTPPEGASVDFSNWEGVWIIDAWANIVCPAKRYLARLTQRMKKWQSEGKHIVNGLKTIEATDPEWLKALVENRKVVVRKPTKANPRPWKNYSN